MKEHKGNLILTSLLVLLPLAAGLLLGGMLFVIGCCRPLRESLHKKFFL